MVLLMEEIMKKRVLIISNNKKLKINLHSNILEYIQLICPSRISLEEILLNEHFECILPLDAVIEDKFNQKYNLLKVLDNYNIEHFGNLYIKYITVNEKAFFISQTGFHMKSQYFSSEHYPSLVKSISEDDFPILVDTNDNIDHILYSNKEIKNILRVLIKNGNKSVTLYKQYQFDSVYHSVIIGNMQNNLFAISGGKDNYWSKIRKITFEMFSKFYFNDFLHLTFGRKGDRLYIININVGNPTDNHILVVLNEKYNLSIEQVITLYAYHSYIKGNYQTEVIVDFLNKLPKKVINKIVSLEIKQKCNIKYNYTDICNQLRSRILSNDDSNRYEFSKMITHGLNFTPESNTRSYCLGNIDFNYDKYLSSYEQIPAYPSDPNLTLKNSLKMLNGQPRWNSSLSFYNICPPTMMNTVAAATITNMYNPNGMIDRTSAGYLRMEMQLVRQLSVLLDIDPSVSSGIFTSGGKVCLTYGVKCGLNRCEREYKSKKPPVIITSHANHFSVEDVAFQLGIKECKRISLTDSQEIYYQEFEQCISTCMQNKIPIACIIVSGGNTMHSVVEDISRVKEIVNRNIDKFHLSYSPYIYYDMVVCWPWLFYKSYDFCNNPLCVEKPIIQKIKFITDRLKYSNLADGFGFDFHKGGFSPYSTSLFITKNMYDLYSINSLNGEIRDSSCYHSFNNSRSTIGIIAAWNILQSVGAEGFQSYVANALKISEVLSNTFIDAGIAVLNRDNTYGFATLIWIKSPKLSQTTLSNILTSDNMQKENDKYIYQFTEYLKREGNTQLCVRYLPKYNYKGYLLTAISFLSMTLNLDQKKALEIANYVIKMKKEFDSKYITDNFFDFESAPENVPR